MMITPGLLARGGVENGSYLTTDLPVPRPFGCIGRRVGSPCVINTPILAHAAAYAHTHTAERRPCPAAARPGLHVLLRRTICVFPGPVNSRVLINYCNQTVVLSPSETEW
eukprot:6194137-Pleurochrysis_carterae.AAC.4